MALAVERVDRRYTDIEAGVPIPVDIPLFEQTDVYVYYGVQGITATLNVDYTVALAPEEFNTFTLTPTAALLTKINDLIAADPANEVNYITVRRTMNYQNVATPGVTRDPRFLTREFDRISMRDMQLAEELRRALKLSPRFANVTTIEVLDLVAGAALIVDPVDATKIIPGPNAAQIGAAQSYAEDAEAARDDAEAAALAAQTFDPANFQAKVTALTNFLALAFAQNKLPYLTGEDTWALTDFTDFARQLLNDANDSTMRATLGLGDVAVLGVTDENERLANNDNDTNAPTNAAVLDLVYGGDRGYWLERHLRVSPVVNDNLLTTTALASGSFATQSAGSNVAFPGLGVRIRSSATANSGATISLNNLRTSLTPSGKLKFKARLGMPSSPVGTVRFGFIATTTTDHNPVAGDSAYFQIAGGFITPIVNAVGGGVGTPVAIAAQDRFIAEIDMLCGNAGPTGNIRFRVFRMSGTPAMIMDQTLAVGSWGVNNDVTPRLIAFEPVATVADIITVFSIGYGVRY